MRLSHQARRKAVITLWSYLEFPFQIFVLYKNILLLSLNFRIWGVFHLFLEHTNFKINHKWFKLPFLQLLPADPLEFH